MRLPVITAILTALLVCSALATQAQAAQGYRNCTKGSASAFHANRTTAQRKAMQAAISQTVSYQRKGYRLDFSSVVQSCHPRRAVYFCKYSILACKIRPFN